MSRQSPRRRAALLPSMERTVIGGGLLSGTSADGIDAALVRFRPSPDGVRLSLLGFRTVPWPRGVRRLLLATSHPDTARLDELATLHILTGELFAEALLGLARSLGIPPSRIGFIGSHGQTVCHLPSPRRSAGRLVRSTLQIGNPSVVAKRSGILTVGDFRSADVAVGGSGAPLVPLCDFLLHGSKTINRAALNIGGIANITILPRGGGSRSVRAFDTGPGNMAIDAVTEALFRRPFDEEGAIAARGRLLPGLLRRLDAHPFIRRRPPKSTGREEFGGEFARSILRAARGARPEDVVATVTEFTALSVYRNVLLHVPRGRFPEELIVSGGGASNRTLLDALRRYFHPATVVTSAERGIPEDAKEAVCFALLAWRTLSGLTGNLPAVTGARRPTILGTICPP